MVQSMVSVVVISLMVWVSIPHMGTWDHFGLQGRRTSVGAAVEDGQEEP